MRYLSEHNSERTIHIEMHCRISHATLNIALERLSAAGLITESTGPKERRITLTEDGRQMLQQISPAMEQLRELQLV